MKRLAIAIILLLPSCAINQGERSGGEMLQLSPRIGKVWSAGVTAKVGKFAVGPAITIEKIHDPRAAPDAEEGDPPFEYPVSGK